MIHIDSKAGLTELSDDMANLNLVMIHKFLAGNNVSAQSLIDTGVVPTFEKLPS